MSEPIKTKTPEYKTERSGSSKVLEDLFRLGYSESDNFVIYEDGDGQEVVIRFRTLYPHEIQEIYELSDRYTSAFAKLLCEQMETLARATIAINNTPLTISEAEIEELKKTHTGGREPTQVDIKRYIFTEKIKSEHILDAMFDAYTQFAVGIKEQFDEVKKKLQSRSSSN